ncbi:MAG: M1 family metallopeptidase [Deferribacteres bacterium]|nr:M1 family metallopeptidase [candidate division KSB1 bacterium]MCB9503639.1 M1 family metallopeptidase [Deferribacteres bacterium]
MAKYNFVLLLTIFTLFSCVKHGETVITLLDSNTKTPIEGAILFNEGSTLVLRSDVHGAITLPPALLQEKLTIHAKGYRALQFLASITTDTLQLQFEKELVNPVEAKMVFSRADTLRGTYGPFRENNDLRTYDLDVKVDVANKYLSGKNAIQFTMLKDDNRIQIDLFANMGIDSILFEGRTLSYTREFNAVFIDFPKTLSTGSTYTIDFYYSGNPKEAGRFGGLVFSQDSLGNPWIFTACQNIGASLWWPNKDQQPDEVDSMMIHVSVPSELTDVSNGKFISKDDLGDGFTRYNWKVHYPINNYSVALNIGKYAHFSEQLGDLPLDYFVLPYHLDAAKQQFSQVIPMLECYEKHFGDYPFPRDGFKLVEVSYAGMEHQSAVAYGNGYRNGYLGMDWTGVGISKKFDFIIIHECGHEWFGNSVSANDVSDAWIHEGWTTYAEGVYVECQFGYEDALRYLNGYKPKIHNKEPIIGPTAVNHWPTIDQYFKGALFLNTLRHVIDDDAHWWALIKDYSEHFKYKNIWTVDVITYFNDHLDRDLRPLFEQYLYHADLPVLQYKFEADKVSFRWQANVTDFDMPVKIRFNGVMEFIRPTTQWQTQTFPDASKENWLVATDLFYLQTEEVNQ